MWSWHPLRGWCPLWEFLDPSLFWSRYSVAQVLRVNARHGYVCIFIPQPMYLLENRSYCIYFKVKYREAYMQEAYMCSHVSTCTRGSIIRFIICRWNEAREDGRVLKPDCLNGVYWDSITLHCPNEGKPKLERFEEREIIPKQ